MPSSPASNASMHLRSTTPTMSPPIHKKAMHTSMLDVEVVKGGLQQAGIVRKTPGQYEATRPDIREPLAAPMLDAGSQSRQKLQYLTPHHVRQYCCKPMAQLAAKMSRAALFLIYP